MRDDKLTKKMRDILFAAAGQAQGLNHEYIGTEHLLLALVAARESSGATTLRELGVGLDAVANRVRNIIQRGRSDGDAQLEGGET